MVRLIYQHSDSGIAKVPGTGWGWLAPGGAGWAGLLASETGRKGAWDRSQRCASIRDRSQRCLGPVAKVPGTGLGEAGLLASRRGIAMVPGTGWHGDRNGAWHRVAVRMALYCLDDDARSLAADGYRTGTSHALAPRRSEIGGLVKSPNRLSCLVHGVADPLMA